MPLLVTSSHELAMAEICQSTSVTCQLDNYSLKGQHDDLVKVLEHFISAKSAVASPRRTCRLAKTIVSSPTIICKSFCTSINSHAARVQKAVQDCNDFWSKPLRLGHHFLQPASQINLSKAAHIKQPHQCAPQPECCTCCMQCHMPQLNAACVCCKCDPLTCMMPGLMPADPR